MTTAEGGSFGVGADGRPRIERPSFLTVGTVVWLSSELMFFAGLFAAVYTLRAHTSGPWPPEGTHVNVALGAVLTAILVSSSFTQHQASKAAEHGHVRDVQRWLGITIALGVIFLAGQAFEWSELEFSISTNAFGSSFYTLTGFHGLHVIAGILALSVALFRTTQPAYRVNGRSSIEMVTAYWHFVDVIWLAVYATLYLL